MMEALHVLALNLILSSHDTLVLRRPVLRHPSGHITSRNQAVISHSLIPRLLFRLCGLALVRVLIFLLLFELESFDSRYGVDAHPVVRIIDIHDCQLGRWVLGQEWRVLVRGTLGSSSCLD